MRFGFIFLVILLQLSLPFQFQRHINEIKSSNRDWIQMGLPNPFRAAKNLLGLADWRNVNIGTETRQILTRSDLEERAQFTKESLGPILEGVEDPNLNEDDEMFDTEIDRESMGLSSRSENSIESLLKERSELENEYQYIMALEQRNAAQLGSFVDKQAQWEATSEEEKRILSRKETVIECIQALKDLLDVMGDNKRS